MLKIFLYSFAIRWGWCVIIALRKKGDEMKRIILKDFLGCKELGSRYKGELVREKIKPLLDKEEKVILDFKDIEIATHFVWFKLRQCKVL